ncbi:hypothetical protein B0J18DRAFT_438074 [Chaetomium sp. MPI-SDFR-AT-0129]|nr:hypothetical protein B0J18DRAFT_438074 [Chaetomium sp. MPI-SDFR-AT-0129]
MGALHPPSSCGFFSAVRYWQAMTVTHVKEDLPLVSKIAVPSVSTPNDKAPVTPQHNIISTHAYITAPVPTLPPMQSFSPAQGGAKNPAAVDETYVNTALLLILQAVCQEFKKQLPWMHWIPPRKALHVHVPDSAGGKKERLLLFEARVDGYLCELTQGISNPKAICEAKAAVRRSQKAEIERQESAEMAAWICSYSGKEPQLRGSASGRKRSVSSCSNHPPT